MPRFSRMRHHTRAARRPRKLPTEAEHRLWQRLRGETLGVAFRRQHPVAGFILDFYAPALQLAVECGGGQHAGSPGDAARTALLARRGISVLRFRDDEVLANTDGVLAAIQAVLRLLASQTPTLSLPLPWGGDPGTEVAPTGLRLTLAERRA